MFCGEAQGRIFKTLISLERVDYGITALINCSEEKAGKSYSFSGVDIYLYFLSGG